eukprot:scaffold2305_cov216-Chaetoceros_neogracile.AAC.5
MASESFSQSMDGRGASNTYSDVYSRSGSFSETFSDAGSNYSSDGESEGHTSPENIIDDYEDIAPESNTESPMKKTLTELEDNTTTSLVSPFFGFMKKKITEGKEAIEKLTVGLMEERETEKGVHSLPSLNSSVDREDKARESVKIEEKSIGSNLSYIESWSRSYSDDGLSLDETAMTSDRVSREEKESESRDMNESNASRIERSVHQSVNGTERFEQVSINNNALRESRTEDSARNDELWSKTGESTHDEALLSKTDKYSRAPKTNENTHLDSLDPVSTPSIEIDNTNIEMDLHSDDFQSTFGSNLSNIDSGLPKNLMQDTICTDDSPGDSLDRYSTTRLDTSSMENRTCDSTMGSAFGFKSAVDENEDIEQTMDPEVVQCPGSCSGSSSSSLDDDDGDVQPDIEQVVISVEQIVDPLPGNQVPKVVSSSSDSIGNKSSKSQCVTSKTNSIDGVSMQIHGEEEESGPEQMQKIAIVVTTVLDQMDTSVEAISLSGESGSVFSVSSEETESSSTRYQRISALIPLSPENEKGVADSNQPDLNYYKDILDDDSQDSFMGDDYSKYHVSSETEMTSEPQTDESLSDVLTNIGTELKSVQEESDQYLNENIASRHASIGDTDLKDAAREREDVLISGSHTVEGSATNDVSLLSEEVKEFQAKKPDNVEPARSDDNHEQQLEDILQEGDDGRGGGLGFGIKNTLSHDSVNLNEEHTDEGIAASSKDNDSIESIEPVDFLLSNTATQERKENVIIRKGSSEESSQKSERENLIEVLKATAYQREKEIERIKEEDQEYRDIDVEQRTVKVSEGVNENHPHFALVDNVEVDTTKKIRIADEEELGFNEEEEKRLRFEAKEARRLNGEEEQHLRFEAEEAFRLEEEEQERRRFDAAETLRLKVEEEERLRFEAEEEAARIKAVEAAKIEKAEITRIATAMFDNFAAAAAGEKLADVYAGSGRVTDETNRHKSIIIHKGSSTWWSSDEIKECSDNGNEDGQVDSTPSIAAIKSKWYLDQLQQSEVSLHMNARIPSSDQTKKRSIGQHDNIWWSIPDQSNDLKNHDSKLYRKWYFDATKQENEIDMISFDVRQQKDYTLPSQTQKRKLTSITTRSWFVESDGKDKMLSSLEDDTPTSGDSNVVLDSNGKLQPVGIARPEAVAVSSDAPQSIEAAISVLKSGITEAIYALDDGNTFSDSPVTFKNPVPTISTCEPAKSDDILKKHTTRRKAIEVEYATPQPQVQDLMEALKSDSASRRSNASGTLKLMASQKKNVAMLGSTLGLMDSLLYVSKIEAKGSDAESIILTKNRALTAIALICQGKENRRAICEHDGLLDLLFDSLKNTDGEERLHSCSAIAALAKTEENRDILADKDGLIGVLVKLLATLKETGLGGTADSEGKVPASKTKMTAARKIASSTRLNACAALLHLSKQCTVSVRIVKPFVFMSNKHLYTTSL